MKAMDDQKETLAEFNQLIGILNRQGRFAKTEDVAAFFKELIGFVKKLRPDLEKFLTESNKGVEGRLHDKHTQAYSDVRALLTELEEDLEDRFAVHRRGSRRSMDAFKEDMRRRFTHLAEVVTAMPRMEEVDSRVEAVRALIPEVETAEDTRDLLEGLEGDERLDKSAIAGIEDIESDIEELKKNGEENKGKGNGVGSYHGVQVLVDGVDKGLTGYINLIAGAGLIISTNQVGERLDVTLTVSGGTGGLSVLVPTSGAVDDSNTAFTFATEPQLVVVNGAPYRNGHGVTITGTSVTLDFPVGDGGDIYGLG